MTKINRIGETKINNQGLEMRIINYRKYSDIDVIFKDGFISRNKTYNAFKLGKIMNHNYNNIKYIDKTGEEKINNQGLKMRIIKYNNCFDIDVMFDDGYIKENITYQNFKDGKVNNINFKRSNFKSKIGETIENKWGEKATIIEYNKFSDITIQFENGEIRKKCDYRNFKNKNIKSKFSKTVLGIGFLGQGKYSFYNGTCKTKEYGVWYNMLLRCYNEKYKQKHTTYKDCKVCDEWHNFQNFAKWFNENYYEIENQKMNLDKDILIKGNKIYSPETCIFVPQRINKLFTKKDCCRGKYPLGVEKYNSTNKFIATCRILIENKAIYKKLGIFNTPIEAFNTYKEFKEKYIKQVADEYKDKIPDKLYKAMYNWKVEITD